MKTADERMDVEAASVQGATRDDTEPIPSIEHGIGKQSPPIRIATETDGTFGYGIIENESDNSSPTSKPSVARSKHWRLPLSVKEFAAQANAVATMVLNGEVETDMARTYSSIARTVAQAMSTEVARARFLNQRPELSFESDLWETDDADPA